MHETALSFFWHQHQPYYPDDVGGENPMPWVRLHGTKDYWGMAMLLAEVPEFHATINLVPSLLEQLLAYTDAGREDTHLRISRLPADSLSEEDMLYLMDNFFMVHYDQMIRPFRRYDELYKMRGLTVDKAERARKRFSKKDIVDLQCWSNLAWIHPLAFERDADLAEFRDKGRNWTEKEKQWLLDKQLELLREVVPLHRELQDRGQIELTTTPYYHPIMPLLWDKRLARTAMPHVVLPKHLDGYAPDVREHIRRAVKFHTELFGQRPRGMWPSEGSVCQEIIAAIARAGIRWIATDEEVLAGSTNGAVSRDQNGHLRRPEMLYRPWRVEGEGKQLQIIFRDHALSDMIGFDYQRLRTKQAVDDFIGRIEAIGNATRANDGHRPTLVSIILDGENCWEYYHNGGVDFLRELYRRVAKHEKIQPVTVSDYLEDHPATDKIEHLFPGSWIQHNFGIWIGHSECNQAWDALHETRKFLNRATRKKDKTKEQLDRAWQELYIAEGSDWFWWFGDDHTSSQDMLFDRLFRKHLQNVYMLLDEEPPAELASPIAQGGAAPSLYAEPTALLSVRINGHKTYFEWINAGHYICDAGRGAMTKATEGAISDLYFGFDHERLLVRLDARGGPVREQLADIDSLNVVFLTPDGYKLTVKKPWTRRPDTRLYHNGVLTKRPQIEAAGDMLFELAVPFESLKLGSEEPVQFFIELVRNEQAVERIPSEGAIQTTVPSPDYELVMWQV